MVGRERRRILVGLAVAIFLGVAVYFRLWTIDYSVSSDDAELLRRQFDIANREAMDESAEWRLRFDEEADKASKCAKELEEIKESTEKKEDSTSSNEKLAMLQKENAALLKQVEMLKNELEAEKRRCHSE
ncbi:hypothetical protein QQP08_016921 [Theobroma cacao]|uniref:Uncharacterized protein n=1 Tax=Theobroma cacao TaxID=3641 RepID=A0A061ES20_THECC|nr:Uncharacterized protein TCM_022159 [Theobroma cacao]WRX24434.1 hypothetical protein QQP08_016921 [Theobroma cacao]